MSDTQRGRLAAVLSPVFLGMAPVLGKYALVGGADPFTVAALRTALVALLLWLGYLLFWRQFVYIYPAGLIACVAIGFTNGIGSLFYYSGLDLLDASIAQVLNATYVIFVVLLTRIEGTRINTLTLLRIGVALLGVMFITGGLAGSATWLGIGLMLGNALLFGGTVVMSQRILYEMPPQTVTLYVMSAMAAVVVVARLVYSQQLAPLQADALWAIAALAITTALSRLTLFAGVKGVGSIRTSLLAVGEGAVAVGLAFLFLDESLTTVQWMGVAILVTSLLMPTERPKASQIGSLPNVAGLRFRRMAGINKLSTSEMESLKDIAFGTPEKLTTLELEVLRPYIGDDGVERVKSLEARYGKRRD